MAKAANRRTAAHAAARARRPVTPAARTPGRAKKISITVDEHVLHEVRQVIHRTGHTLSAHVTEALAGDLRRRHLQQLIEQYESKHGVITEEELARARDQWQG
ncbi:MAG: hypothetical protein JW940_30225 [Polyangiaceae bacterium]|nr:hypothetical protein [Polyangiaceae bacterium]